MRRRLPTLVLVCFAVALTVGPWACSSPTSPSSGSVSGFLSGAASLGSTSNSAMAHGGKPPAASGGPSAAASGDSRAASGGASGVSIGGSAPFQTVYVSIGGASGPTTAESAATPDGYLQIDLPSPVMSLPISVSYADSLPTSSFDLVFQLGAPGGATGPSTSLHKTVNNTKTIFIVGIVFATNPPPPRPVQGAVVSTTLDSVTATTDANGAFDLHTNTPQAHGMACFTVTIRLAGQPVYSVRGNWGDAVTSAVFILDPPAPIINPCQG